MGEERIVGRGILRPHMSKTLHLQKIAVRLDSLCAKRDEACDVASAVRSRIWRILQTWDDEAAEKLLQLALTSVRLTDIIIPVSRDLRGCTCRHVVRKADSLH